MRSSVTLRLVGEVAEIARGSHSRKSFRTAVTPLLARTLGFDCAVWTFAIQPDWSDDSAFAWHFPIETVKLARSRKTVIGEIAAAARQALEKGAIVNLGTTARTRQKSALFNEIFWPAGLFSHVGLAFDIESRQTLLSIARASGPGFGQSDADAFNDVAPVLALSESLCARRERGALSSALTPRERDIAELVERGLTNAEIAKVLGISKNTVRNRLAAAFERTGSSNRAELVARLHSE